MGLCNESGSGNTAHSPFTSGRQAGRRRPCRWVAKWQEVVGLHTGRLQSLVSGVWRGAIVFFQVVIVVMGGGGGGAGASVMCNVTSVISVSRRFGE